MPKLVDAVVVGAGPVGLLTAIELALGGARVLVLERLAAPSQTIKALGIGPLGCEALQRRGLSAAMAEAEGRSLAAMNSGQPGGLRSAKFSGHFGFLFIRKDAQTHPDRGMRAIDQQNVEAMLADRACALGIEIRRRCEVTGFEQGSDAVTVRWATPDGSDEVRCAYLVGCDGGRSAIRKMAGFAFPGTPPTLTMYQAIADLDDPQGVLPAGWHRTPQGMFAFGALFQRRLFMMDFSGPPADRDAPVTREEIEAVLRRISGVDVHVASVEVANRWTDNTRLVDTYRAGRVLLAGDAAHVHSPFGGQGLSLGLTDAANLGWKLAAVLRGDRPDSLLDTYTDERRPVAEAVLANTLGQAAIMRPDPQAGAMRDVMAKLLQLDDVNRVIGEMMSGLATRYDLGSERDEVGRLVGDEPAASGDRAMSLYEALQDGLGVLLDATPGGQASKLVAATAPRVRCLTVAGGPSRLIRPDACVAWAGDGNDLGGLQRALDLWFGAPREASRAA